MKYKKKKKVEKSEKMTQKINIWQPPIFYCPSAVFMILKVFFEISLLENLLGDYQIAGTYAFKKPNTFRLIYQIKIKGMDEMAKKIR